MTVLKYIWGKANKLDIDGEKTYIYHPLICHLIDVAAVAEVYWDKVLSSFVKKRISQFLGKSQDTARRWLIFLSGIHDIGKATPVFQAKVPILAENLAVYNLSIYTRNLNHSFLSGEVFYSHFHDDEFKIKIKDPDLLYNLKYVLSGHHGIFPTSSNITEIIPQHLGTGQWYEVQSKLIEILYTFSGLSQKDNLDHIIESNLLNPEQMNSFIIFISGFICVMDWIGSNENFFDYYIEFTNNTELINNYFNLSRKRALNAIKKIGWDNWKPKKKKKSLPFWRGVSFY